MIAPDWLTLPLSNSAAVAAALPLLSQAAAAHAAEPLTPMGNILQSNLINFLLAVGLFIAIIRNMKVGDSLDKSRETVANELHQLAEQKAKALAELEQLRQKTAHLNTEVDAILTQARTAANSLREQIVADAQAQAQRIETQAAKRGELSWQVAQQALSAQLLEGSVAEVTQRLKTLSPQTHEALLQEFVNQVEHLPVKQG